MMKRYIRLGMALMAVGLLALLVAALNTCSGKAAIKSQVRQRSPQRNEVTLDEALIELAGMECPEGVDEELWRELKDALEEALVDHSPGRRGSLAPQGEEPGWLARPTQFNKWVSSPPTGEANRVNDLTITDNGDGTFTLSWHYKNLGDYDQNGTVGIDDITPIAQHYGETYDVEDANCIQAVIDGSSNGRIGIEDITPLAIHFAEEVHHYAVEGAPEEAGTYELVTEVAQDAGIGDGRLLYNTIIQSPAALWHRVVPYDSEGASGEASNAVIRPSNEPIIYGVSPTEGYQHEEYTFSATATGAEPLEYAWDFGGGATPDTSSEPSPIVTLADSGEYEASLTVTNAYGEASHPFTLTISERDMWAHTWGTSTNESCRALVTGPESDLFLAVTGGGANVLRVDNQGNFIWARRWTGDEGASAGDIAFGTDGNLIVTGGTRSFGEGRSDLLLLKYSVDGELIRAMTWGTGDYEYHSETSVDEAGNVYLCGYWTVYGGKALVLIVKLDPDWNVLWAKRWGGTGEDRAYGILSHEGAVYVCGKTGSFGDPECDALLMKMSPDGEVLWARTWGTELNDSFSALTVDSNGYLYVVGRSYTMDTYDSTGIAAKYDEEGNLLAAISLDGSKYDCFNDMKTDESGNLAVAGSAGEYYFPNIVLLRLTPELNLISSLTWVGVDSGESEIVACALDQQGYIYLGGKAVKAAGAWEELDYVQASPAVETAWVEGSIWELDGVVHDPTGTTTVPEGVIDEGAGRFDILLLKRYIP